MTYPSLPEVAAADRAQLKLWTRSLPVPGFAHAEANVVGGFFSPSWKAWQAVQAAEHTILTRICDRALQLDADLPLEQQALHLCRAIEELPASEQQTRVALLASALHERIQELAAQLK